jgi:hypothetical protein
MPEDSIGEDVLCWLCDYWSVLIVAILVILAAFLLRHAWFPFQQPVILPRATQEITVAAVTPSPASNTFIPQATLQAALPSVTPMPEGTDPVRIVTHTPTPQPTTPPLVKPEFIIVFIPVDWKSSRRSFEEAADRQMALFLSSSNIEDYLTVKEAKLTDGIDGVSLNDEALAVNLVEFGMKKMAADRYIGVTDGNLAPHGNNEISGWSMGPGTQGVIAESQDVSITSHELGHTFGLCDEYSYDFWKTQNSEFPGGCPNPYPADCPRDSTFCLGGSTTDGRFSLMGPSGMSGEYGFNEPCLTHLKKLFSDLARQALP